MRLEPLLAVIQVVSAPSTLWLSFFELSIFLISKWGWTRAGGIFCQFLNNYKYLEQWVSIKEAKIFSKMSNFKPTQVTWGECHPLKTDSPSSHFCKRRIMLCSKNFEFEFLKYFLKASSTNFPNGDRTCSSSCIFEAFELLC